MKQKKIDLLKEKISKETLYEYYIIDNNSYEQTFNHFNITRKDLRRLLTCYEIKKTQKARAQNRISTGRSHESYVKGGKKSAATQKLKWAQKSAEEKDAWSSYCRDVQFNMSDEKKKVKAEKAKATYNMKTEEEKELINKKRSESCKIAWSNEDLINRQHQTYKENRKGRLCRTKSEQYAYDVLITLFPDLVYDEKIDSRYPYFVDFYIPSQDIFIEINTHPTHGDFPYVSGLKESIEECERLRSHNISLDTYTRRDVEKFETACKNQLNYIRIYPRSSLEKNLEINGNKFNGIVKLLVESQYKRR